MRGRCPATVADAAFAAPILRMDSRPSPRTFRPGLVATVATVLFCALTIALGLWQMRRADYKENVQERLDRLASEPAVALPGTPIDPEAFALRRVVAEGEFADRFGILLDNRTLRGRPGYQVITPLHLRGSERYVLVNRGWIAAGRTRADVPAPPTPAGLQRVEGVALVPGGIYELEREQPQGRVWQNLVLDRYVRWSGLAVHPVVLQQTSSADDGLVREWTRPDAGADRHRTYAFQWFTFAALAAGLYGYFGFRKRSAG